MAFGDLSDLIPRLKSSLRVESSKPLAVLCGSGLTVPKVPSVDDIISAVKRSFEADELEALDERLAPFELSSDRYQQAFDFLKLRRAPELRNEIITLATLRAYSNSVKSTLSKQQLITRSAEFEDDYNSWTLPDGVAALGRVFAGLPFRNRGPILTTNFDPLMEIAVRKAGGQVTSYVSVDDSGFLTNLNVQTNSSVVHLHGYWRGADTLHTPEQLMVDRPSLEGSLRAILQDHTLLVVGYGGWNDVVTSTITKLISEGSATNLDVLWTMYSGREAAESEVFGNASLARMLAAPGNVTFYHSIDANALFPALESAIEEVLNYSDQPRARTGNGVPLGWLNLTKSASEELSSGTDVFQAISFFDGRLPTLRDGTNAFIPRRQVVHDVSNILTANLSKRAPSVQLLIGPSGEGKSCALFQIAAEVARNDESIVVHVHESERFSAESITELPSDKKYVLVIDDAYRYIEPLRNLVDKLNMSGRKDIHLVLASRDTDWAGAGGEGVAWNRYVSFRRHGIKGISRPDAVSLVSTWETIGEAALGELARYPSRDRRVNELMNAASEKLVESDGSFLGALLLTRHGAGLDEHIRDLMRKLEARAIPTSGTADELSLLDALLVIAIPHQLGLEGMPLGLLRDSLNISSSTLHAYVLGPLGEEAAISIGGGRAYVRHRMIAGSILRSAPGLGRDLAIPVAAVARSAARALRVNGFDAATARYAHISSLFDRDDPLQVSAARAAAEEDPGELSYRTSMSAALRRVGRYNEAAQSNWDAAHLLTGAASPSNARPFLTEWAVAEGGRGNFALNAFLANLALQDTYRFEPLRSEAAGYSSACAATAYLRLFAQRPNSNLVRGMRGCLNSLEELDSGNSVLIDRLDSILSKTSIAITQVGTVESDLEAANGYVRSLLGPETLPAVQAVFRGYKQLAALLGQ